MALLLEDESYSAVDYVNSLLSSSLSQSSQFPTQSAIDLLKSEKLKLEMKGIGLHHDIDRTRSNLTSKIPDVVQQIQQIVLETDHLRSQIQDWSRYTSVGAIFSC
jgi:hypothetical protein